MKRLSALALGLALLAPAVLVGCGEEVKDAKTAEAGAKSAEAGAKSAEAGAKDAAAPK
ncbi:MAG: hypothetical protein JWN86_4381 [Planctomycetota bacterium]|nr:hypothetical protein [Planctomycetota bacterium]